MKRWSSILVVWISWCLLTGCGAHREAKPDQQEAKRDLIVLLPDPDGKVGAITVTTQGGSQKIDRPGYGTEVEDLSKPPIAPQPVNEKEIKDVFGPALLAQPDPTGRFVLFILYFDHDTTRLTRESNGLLPKILGTIKSRRSNEVYVVGHTDLVGPEGYNVELSLRRANHVRDMFVSNGVKPNTLFISFYGKARPLVPTENEVPEPRNRRVEVIVR